MDHRRQSKDSLSYSNLFNLEVCLCFLKLLPCLALFGFALIWQVLCFMFVIHMFELGTLNVSELKCIFLHIEIENLIVIFYFFFIFFIVVL